MTNIEVTSNDYTLTRETGDSVGQFVKLKDPITNDDTRHVLEIIFFVVINGVGSVVGSSANVINIIIFIKQGFSDSVNISLCGLAISDLGSLITLVWKSICINPLFRYSGIDFDSVQIQIPTAGWPHRSFICSTNWITAFITFERCVCIALPMKVKDIITPKRTLVTVVLIFVTTMVIVSPLFSTVYIAPSFNFQQNKTLYGLTYTSFGSMVQIVSNSIIVFVQLSSFIIVTICTVILLYNLVIKSRWRKKATGTSLSKSDSASLRDQRVMRMITFISCILIVCFLPNAVNLIVMSILPTVYSIGVLYENTYQVVWAILSTLEIINSSTTIIVYYNMSSKYRNSFNKLFLQESNSQERQ